MPVNAPCKRCGKNMRIGSDGKFCQKCIARYSTDELNAYLHFQKPLCHQCGKPVEWAMQCHLETGRSNFCSRACHNLAMSKIKESDWPEIVRLYRDEHLTSNQIGKRYGCTGTVVLKVLRRFDVLRLGAQPGVANVMYGKTHTPEVRARLRESSRRQFLTPESRQRQGEITAQQIKDGRTGKSYNTLEKAFAAILDDIGASYEWQHKLGRYVFDFLLHKPNMLIETHGEFWHADPRFFDRSRLRAIQTSNLANDARKETAARAAGFKFAYFWEHDVHNNPDQVKTELLAILNASE